MPPKYIHQQEIVVTPESGIRIPGPDDVGLFLDGWFMCHDDLVEDLFWGKIYGQTENALHWENFHTQSGDNCRYFIYLEDFRPDDVAYTMAHFYHYRYEGEKPVLVRGVIYDIDEPPCFT